MASANRIVPTEGPFAVDVVNTAGLHFAVRGGKILVAGQITNVPNASVLLVDAATNYVEMDDAGRVSVNQSGFTSGRTSLYQLTVAGGVITAVQAARASGGSGGGTVWAGGVWG